MDDRSKTYEELLIENGELKRDNDSLKIKYHDAVTNFERVKNEIDSLEIRLQTSIDSTNDVVTLLDRKYRQLVDCSNEAIVVVKGGFLCLTNPITRTITGYSEEEIGTIPFQLFIHPEDRARVVENHLKRLKGENIPSYYVFRLLNKNGSIRWVYMNAVLIDWDGSPATLNFLTDITNLKLAEEALEQSSQKWEAVIAASPDGIGMISLDGKIQLISDKLIRMHGYESNKMIDILGRSIFDFIDPSDHKLLLENTRKLISGEKSKQITEYKAVKKDNSRFYIDVNASVLHDSNGKPTSILYVERDITERKLAEAEIKKSNQELAKLNSEKDKLFSIIAHDLKSSFNNLIGFTEALATDSHNMSPAVITKYSSSLYRSVLALYTLLENLLEWALLQKGSILFTPKYLKFTDIFSLSKGSI
ncbi:MAG: PAS domain S-box protein, partial [Ignavibacteriaceae bacterium]|nr:PAS domain S-box protein [Ignavibacteriaceae bacterium]